MQKLRTVFFGTPGFAVPSFVVLAAKTTLVAAVVRPDRPKGRGRKLQQPPVKIAAIARGIEVLQPEGMKEPWFQERLRELAPDLIVTAAFGRIIPPGILDLPPHGCWNVHASLLPRYRGAAPIQRALWEGETETGVTLMRMDPGLDTGPMLLKRSCPIEEDDDAGTLTDRLAELGAATVEEGLGLLAEGRLEAMPQPAEGTVAPMITHDETVIDWTRPADRIRNQVRALAPRPGARTTTPGGEVKILAARPMEGDACRPGVGPGTVVLVTKKELLVAAGEGTCLSVGRLQPAGRAPMDAGAYLQGRAVREGDRWGEGGNP